MGNKTLDIAVIGNGPSRVIYDTIEQDFDIRIGCNYGPHEVDYRSFVDAYAAKFYRQGQKFHKDLGTFKFVLGERCAAGLNRIKAVPASTDSLFERLRDKGHVAKYREADDYIYYPKAFRDEQRYLSSGHLAFLYAATETSFGEANRRIHMFGFDVVFTGDHLATFSNIDIREWDKPHIDRVIRDRPRTSAVFWLQNWNKLFDHCDLETGTEVIFYGYEEDPKLPFTHKEVRAEYVPKVL